jgi:AcrR family transcriptional regulator
MEVVALRGFDATVDEIAQLSGVSPRTVFRHYASHDRLLAETVKDMFEASARHPHEGLPRLVDDLDGWLEGLPQRVDDLDSWLESVVVTIHTRAARIFGRAFWDIHAPNGKSTPALTELAALRRQFRLQGVQYLATLVWNTAGGRGDPPPGRGVGLRPQPLGLRHPGAHDRLRPDAGPDRRDDGGHPEDLGAAGPGKAARWMTGVRPAQARDRADVVRTVAAAFAHDPAWGFLLGDEYDRLAPLFAAALFDTRVAAGGVWVTSDVGAVAVWEERAGETTSAPEADDRWSEYRIAAGPGAWDRLREYERAVDEARPSRPYWYLGVLATAPDRQRRGLATSVMGPVLDRADREELDCCLETSTIANTSFYRGRGFTEATAVHIAAGPPTWWLCRPYDESRPMARR